MRAAIHAIQRPRDAKLLVVDAAGGLHQAPRSALAQWLAPGDLLVANDAATLPASLAGTHAASGRPIEVRLAGRRSLAPDDVHAFTAVVFGAGDWRTPTEHRPMPPALAPGDVLTFGAGPAPLTARIVERLGHPRLVSLAFDGPPDAVWAGIARHGRAIQYAHLAEPLALWDAWTRIAALPVAFEPPSAGFVLDWAMLAALAARGIGFATLTHAAGLSSTGDTALDARLPLDEPYRLPAATARAVRATRQHGGRIVALGTTVVRALEHAGPALRPGDGLATQRIGPATRLQIVDALVSGTHAPGSSHHALLQAFAPAAVLRRVDAALEAHGYRTHEFGDSVLIDSLNAARSAGRMAA